MQENIAAGKEHAGSQCQRRRAREGTMPRANSVYRATTLEKSKAYGDPRRVSVPPTNPPACPVLQSPHPTPAPLRPGPPAAGRLHP
eukprot:356728-Chlamydomonas_euryale.AAC.4